MGSQRVRHDWATFHFPYTQLHQGSPIVSNSTIWLILSSVTQSCPTLCNHGLQHAMPPCPSPTPRVHPNSCPLSQWWHPTISSSVVPFSCSQSFPASGSFQMSTLRIRWPKYWSFSFSISPSSEHPGLISFRINWLDLLVSKGLSRVFSNTTLQKHQFFSAQPSL